VVIHPNPNITNVQPTSTDHVTDNSDHLFLKCNINGQEVYVLPDSGNRARCVLDYKLFKRLFPKAAIEPCYDRITTAKKNDVLKVVGIPRQPISLKFANNKYIYNVRPLLARQLQLPCLLSASDMSKMPLRVDYQTKQVEIGPNRCRDQLVPIPAEPVSLDVHLMHNEVLHAYEEAILPVRIEDGEIDNTYVVEGDLKSKLLTMDSVDRLRPDRMTYIRVSNPSVNTIHLKGGT